MTLEQFDFSGIEQMMGEIFQGSKMSFAEIVEGLMSGELELSLQMFLDFIFEQVTYEIGASKNGMIHILLLVLISALFTNFSGMFKSTQVAEISFSMLYMLLITICLNNFRILVTAAGEHLARLMDFMEVLGPLYFLAVSVATGSATSVSFYQIILLVIYLVEMLIVSLLLPAAQIYLVVKIMSEFSPEIQLSKFAELLETIVSWLLKSLLAAIIGLNLIQRILSPAIDSVKRGLLVHGGGAIPIIGDVAGGAAEMVLGTAVLIKNGIGVAGMLICLVICLTPVIQMTITTLLYLVVSALVQPISDKRMVNCISSMADGSKMLLEIMFTTGILFLLTIAVAATTTGGV